LVIENRHLWCLFFLEVRPAGSCPVVWEDGERKLTPTRFAQFPAQIIGCGHQLYSIIY